MGVLAEREEGGLVNAKVPRPWEDQVNETLADGVKRYKNTVLVDWHGYRRRPPRVLLGRRHPPPARGCGLATPSCRRRSPCVLAARPDHLGSGGAPCAKLVSRNAPLPRALNPGPRHRRRWRRRRRLPGRARSRARSRSPPRTTTRRSRSRSCAPGAAVHRATGPTARRWTSSASKTARHDQLARSRCRQRVIRRGDRHRRPVVLDQRRHRPRRGVPCVPHQRHLGQDRAGWLHDHPAAGEEPHPLAEARREPQDQGDRGRAAAEREVLEGEDPRGVPQHRLLRVRTPTASSRAASRFFITTDPGSRLPARQAPRRAHHRRGRAPRRRDLEPRGQQPVHVSRPRASSGAPTCCRRKSNRATSRRPRPTPPTTSRCPPGPPPEQLRPRTSSSSEVPGPPAQRPAPREHAEGAPRQAAQGRSEDLPPPSTRTCRTWPTTPPNNAEQPSGRRLGSSLVVDRPDAPVR